MFFRMMCTTATDGVNIQANVKGRIYLIQAFQLLFQVMTLGMKHTKGCWWISPRGLRGD